MSDKIKKMPPFTKPIVVRWIQVNLASDVPPSEAAEKFLKKFPEYNSQEYGDDEKRFSIVKNRLYHYNSDPRNKNYHEIKKRRALEKKDIADISLLSNPLERLFWLENLLFCGANFTVSEEIKILTEIGKLADRITGEDRKRTQESTYGGLNYEPTKRDYGMARGTDDSTEEESQETT